FESGSHLRLVGALPEARDAYTERSPVTHARAIKAPVLLLHGDADRNVVPAHSAAVADALRRAGTPVERHVYAGEGHGWRRAATSDDELTRTEAFLDRWLP
ncbi:MAG TPA: prolyl oligopeptidase family serine peptidase, partial [Acidimicrobiia bacterium]|nr:prolyl oligopeptidase family serine peptidase [Acidimicrobiia bacterium]